MRLRLAELAALASGFSALVFETLFLRLAGYTFGTTQLAASITLGSFMLGLALGSLFAGRWSRGWQRPALAYAALECVIGLSGFALVWAFPLLSGWYLDAVRGQASVGMLGDARAVIAFALITLPAIAMGMTLPLWVHVCRAGFGVFGAALGRLYGSNTLGAVLGVLAAELLLIPQLGLTGSALAALGINVLAGLLALAWLDQRSVAAAVEKPGRPVARYCMAAALSGFLLLALEVLWFRFLHLYVLDSVVHFAWMLATVLAGIAFGGLAAGWWLRSHSASGARIAALALVTGCSVLLCWWGFRPPAGGTVPNWATQQRDVLLLCMQLMLLPALGSGAMYAMLGALLRDSVHDDAAAAGWLGFFNTLAAAAGAVVAGFVLLPMLGSETSLRLLVFGYLGLAFLLMWGDAGRVLPVAAAMLALLLIALPETLSRHLDRAAQKFTDPDGSAVVLRREGRYQYLQYLRRAFAGETRDIRLVTNGYSMSASTVDSRRYMQTFAWLPLQLHADPKQALLVSYGLGLTAQALLSDPRLQRLDIVDISADTVAGSRALMPGAQPLDDPRTRLHIQDGRFFMAASDTRYDLITGEPPPPRARGVVNLYTQEYFAAMYNSLRDGGLASYWLPVDQLSLSSSQSIVRAFCAEFADCTLWAGANYNWILVGTRNAVPAVDTASTRLWQHRDSARLVLDNGHEGPQSLFATFLADAGQLADWAGSGPVLVDNYPALLESALPTAGDLQAYFTLMDDRAALQRFRSSEWVRRWLEPEFRASVEQLYPLLPVLNNQVRPQSRQALPVLDAMLRHGPLRVPLLWLLGSDLRLVRIADRAVGDSAELAWHRAASSIAAGDVQSALILLQPYAPQWQDFRAEVYLYLLCAGGWSEEAIRYADSMRERGMPTEISCW